MITKLKTECGCQFTQRLESMFKDKVGLPFMYRLDIHTGSILMVSFLQEIWGTLAANFKDYCTTNPMGLQMDVGVRVLTAGIWPTQSAAPQCVLPDSCQAAFDHFKQVCWLMGRKVSMRIPPFSTMWEHIMVVRSPWILYSDQPISRPSSMEQLPMQMNWVNRWEITVVSIHPFVPLRNRRQARRRVILHPRERRSIRSSRYGRLRGLRYPIEEWNWEGDVTGEYAHDDPSDEIQYPSHVYLQSAQGKGTILRKKHRIVGEL